MIISSDPPGATGPDARSAPPHCSSREERGAVWPALTAAFLGLTTLAGVSLFADRAEGEYLVIGSPFAASRDLLLTIAAADGAVAAAGGFENMMVAVSDKPDFAARLRAAGALMVLPVPRVFGCGVDVSRGDAA
ncbi:hypothetical protein ACFOHK_17595 [Falsigemmobacter intermedius]|uniref:Uncharacterized protein n=1 Tax=Falsigemmobacter intermedius TaxID=1553448 RepID=A0A3S3Y763_9RHOB|nr:hypothetical protein [Falsigemmobacter intermedius]RWY34924.1 hypothetical protein EP867_19130 [Falsigemmobacter intermedius]